MQAWSARMLTVLTLIVLSLGVCSAATPEDGTVELHDFHFDDGQQLPVLKLHYRTLGRPERDSSGHIVNAVLLLHGTTGTADTLLATGYEQALYSPGKPLDIRRFFLVIPDGIGAGGSSKPSDGLHARFPHYGYRDQVRAQHEMLTAIGVTRLKLVLGTSMGGMQTWLWGEIHPDEMDALVAIASAPAAITGRNMMWRAMIADAIRNDPDWRGGDYPAARPPQAWGRTAFPLFTIMTENAAQLQKKGATRAAATALVNQSAQRAATIDANDFLYTFESSADYDPAPSRKAIVKPMLTINFADDLLNPPESLDLPDAANYTKVMLPGGYGHQTLTHPEIWSPALASFMGTIPALH